jgi:hypothetical protein
VIFHDVTLNAGSVLSTRRQDLARLSPAAVEVFARLLREGGESWSEVLPGPGLSHLSLAFTSAGPGAALATFYRGGAGTSTVPLATSALLSGRDAEADTEAAQALQSLALQLYRDTPVEPGFDITAIVERPLLATLVIPGAHLWPRDLGIVGDAETFLAAAYFALTLGEGHGE